VDDDSRDLASLDVHESIHEPCQTLQLQGAVKSILKKPGHTTSSCKQQRRQVSMAPDTKLETSRRHQDYGAYPARDNEEMLNQQDLSMADAHLIKLRDLLAKCVSQLDPMVEQKENLAHTIEASNHYRTEEQKDRDRTVLIETSTVTFRKLLVLLDEYKTEYKPENMGLKCKEKRDFEIQFVQQMADACEEFATAHDEFLNPAAAHLKRVEATVAALATKRDRLQDEIAVWEVDLEELSARQVELLSNEPSWQEEDTLEEQQWEEQQGEQDGEQQQWEEEEHQEDHLYDENFLHEDWPDEEAHQLQQERLLERGRDEPVEETQVERQGEENDDVNGQQQDEEELPPEGQHDEAEQQEEDCLSSEEEEATMMESEGSLLSWQEEEGAELQGAEEQQYEGNKEQEEPQEEAEEPQRGVPEGGLRPGCSAPSPFITETSPVGSVKVNVNLSRDTECGYLSMSSLGSGTDDSGFGQDDKAHLLHPGANGRLELRMTAFDQQRDCATPEQARTMELNSVSGLQLFSGDPPSFTSEEEAAPSYELKQPQQQVSADEKTEECGELTAAIKAVEDAHGGDKVAMIHSFLGEFFATTAVSEIRDALRLKAIAKSSVMRDGQLDDKSTHNRVIEYAFPDLDKGDVTSISGILRRGDRNVCSTGNKKGTAHRHAMLFRIISFVHNK